MTVTSPQTSTSAGFRSTRGDKPADQQRLSESRRLRASLTSSSTANSLTMFLWLSFFRTSNSLIWTSSGLRKLRLLNTLTAYRSPVFYSSTDKLTVRHTTSNICIPDILCKSQTKRFTDVQWKPLCEQRRPVRPEAPTFNDS